MRKNNPEIQSHHDLQYSAPGNLIEIETKIGPNLFGADRMISSYLVQLGEFSQN